MQCKSSNHIVEMVAPTWPIYYYYRVLRAIIMLSASRRQPHLLHVSAVDRRQTWSMDQ